MAQFIFKEIGLFYLFTFLWIFFTIKGWQVDEKEVVGHPGCCSVSKFQMSLVFLQGRVQLKLGKVWHLW